LIGFRTVEVLSSPSNYSLIDCGSGQKLEQCGEFRLIRPSSLALWQRKSPATEWDEFDARFDLVEGWITSRQLPPTWPVQFSDIVVEASLLRNGQIGIFPEHAAAFPLLLPSLKMGGEGQLHSVLNLFGYTGLHTTFAMRHGAEVTHVDVNQPALDTLQRNIKRNNLSPSKLRVIKDDALGFLQRAVRKNSTYQSIVLDPPNFSRFGKGKSWELEDVICELLELCTALIIPVRGSLLFSSHHPALVKESIASIMLDLLPDDYECQVASLGLQDTHGRVLSHGGLTFCGPTPHCS
jgi:23S rRNA (cytosine1962-C5)-methyltransferase